MKKLYIVPNSFYGAMLLGVFKRYFEKYPSDDKVVYGYDVGEMDLSEYDIVVLSNFSKECFQAWDQEDIEETEVYQFLQMLPEGTEMKNITEFMEEIFIPDERNEEWNNCIKAMIDHRFDMQVEKMELCWAINEEEFIQHMLYMMENNYFHISAKESIDILSYVVKLKHGVA